MGSGQRVAEFEYSPQGRVAEVHWDGTPALAPTLSQLRARRPLTLLPRLFSIAAYCVLRLIRRTISALIQKSSWTLIFANRAGAIAVGTRQPVTVEFTYVEFSDTTALVLSALYRSTLTIVFARGPNLRILPKRKSSRFIRSPYNVPGATRFTVAFAAPADKSRPSDCFTVAFGTTRFAEIAGPGKDRKSTRLNSSHVKISYAVFCLKKKKKKPPIFLFIKKKKKKK